MKGGIIMQKIRKYKGFKDFVFTAIVLFLLYSFLHLFPFNSIFASELQESSLAIAIEQYHEGKFKEAIYNLEIALSRSLTKQEKATAYLYLGRCHIITGKPDKAETCFKEALRADPFLQLQDFDSPQIVDAFTKSKNDLPIITGFSIFPELFRPYAGERPEIEFRLSQQADTRFYINDSYNISKHIEKYRGLQGLNRFSWKWENNLLKSDTYSYKLNAEDIDGDYYQAEKKVDIKIKIPAPLRYDGSRFYIPGENFKPEYEKRFDSPEDKIRKIKTADNISKIGGLCVVVGLVMVGLDVYSSNNDSYIESPDWKSWLGLGLITGGLTTWLIAGNVSYSLKKSPLNKPLTKNIRYNAQLRKKIDELLKKIEIEQKEINKEKKE